MAKLNYAILNGIVEDEPHFTKTEDGTIKSATVYLHVVRGWRSTHDGRKYLKHDYPLVITLEPSLIREIAEWKKNDVVMVKGTVNSREITKTAVCPECQTENSVKGQLLYVTPIYCTHIRSFGTKELAVKYIAEGREISNMIICTGTVVKQPVYFKTKHGTIVSQYRIALNRKFRVRTDAPEVRTDYPWVKSYGEQAREDKLRLYIGSNVIIDGIIQARGIDRKCKCEYCEKIFEWRDHTLEIVPYDTEYIAGTYLTDDDIRAQGDDPDDLRQKLFDSLADGEGEADDEVISEEPETTA